MQTLVTRVLYVTDGHTVPPATCFAVIDLLGRDKYCNEVRQAVDMAGVTH